MFRSLKFNVKNVTVGCHNFSKILARHDAVFGRQGICSGFSRLFKPCPHYRQDNVRINTSDQAEAVLPRSFDNVSLKPITSKIPLISNRYQVLTGRIPIEVCGLPWESPVRYYHERKTPKCPPPCPTIPKDCDLPPVPPCPPIAKSEPKCSVKPKCYPCKSKKNPCKPKKNRCAKSTPGNLKTFLLNNCRLFSSKTCKPKTSKPCKPKKCKSTKKSRPCKPKCGGPSGGDACSGGKGLKKGPVCPPKKKGGCA